MIGLVFYNSTKEIYDKRNERHINKQIITNFKRECINEFYREVRNYQTLISSSKVEVMKDVYDKWSQNGKLEECQRH
jgi:hypothetical protein